MTPSFRPSPFVALLALCLALGGHRAANGQPADELRAAHRLLQQINASRAEAQLQALKMDQSLVELSAGALGTSPRRRLQQLESKLSGSTSGWSHWSLVQLRLGPDDDAFTFWQKLRPQSFERVVGGTSYELMGLVVSHDDQGQDVVVIAARSKLSVSLDAARQYRDVAGLRTLLLNRSNRMRRDAGLEELRVSALLEGVAQEYAQRMADEGFYAHKSPQGEAASERVRGAGYHYLEIGENLAKGPFSGDEAVERWFASPGHRANLLRSSARDVGFGIAHTVTESGELDVLWVQLVGRRAGSR